MVNGGQRNTPASHGAGSAVRPRPQETERDAQRSAALLALANRLATAEVPPSRPRARTWWIVLAAAGAAAILAAGLFAVLAMTSNNSAGTPGDEVSLIAPLSTTAGAASGSAASAPTVATADSVRPTPATAPARTGPVPPRGHLVYDDGILTLQGAVATQEMADAALDRARSTLPPDRVRGRFSVDPRAGPPSGEVVVDTGFVFPRDAKALPAEFRPELDRLAAVMRAYPGVTVQVTGFTDSEGSAGYNLSLSTSRAQTVVGYLAQQGIDGSRLTAAGKGEAEPVADNATAAGRALNRRIEIRTQEP